MVNLPADLVLFFDGSCIPKNPGGVAGYGWRLVGRDGAQVAAASGEVCRGPEATNNVAEWAAVRNGLLYLRQAGWTGRLEVRGDSQLVVRQLTGEYQVKKESLRPYFLECRELLSEWQWQAVWIPREQNGDCDALSKEGAKCTT